MDQAHHHHGIGSHSHSHVPVSFGRAFAIGMALNTIYIVAEVFYGIAAHSLALLADATSRRAGTITASQRRTGGARSGPFYFHATPPTQTPLSGQF